ncbi:MAG: hypothetical protein GF414_01485 [Candidatus Altiarchaeales archaeon]|nr:hypothetical protein [Candidatus Altiarchaeales archaeon]
MQCRLCELDPELKAAWGCEQPLPNPVWELDGDYWYSCPILWITDDMALWYREYQYGEKFGAKPFEEQSWYWTEGWLAYERAMGRFAQEKHDKQQAEMRSVTRFNRAHALGDDNGS